MDHLSFTGHALRQMFARRISVEDVQSAVANGRTITEYPDDRPYPSRLLLGRVGERPLHVVVGYDVQASTAYVITAYEPNPNLWNDDFTERRSQ